MYNEVKILYLTATKIPVFFADLQYFGFPSKIDGFLFKAELRTSVPMRNKIHRSQVIKLSHIAKGRVCFQQCFERACVCACMRACLCMHFLRVSVCACVCVCARVGVLMWL